MGRLIVLAAVLTLVNLLAVFGAAQFLKRELRRHFAKADEHHKKICAQLDGCLSYGAETVKTLGVLWNESERQAEALQSLPARDDVSALVKKLEAMLEDSPAGLCPEREAAMSKAMEEGIASILAYTSGKAPGVELRL